MNVITSYKEVKDIINKDFVMVIAKTHTCGACQTIDTALEHNIPAVKDIERYHVYVDDMDQFRGEFLVFSVPTVLLFSKGKELLRESRYINYEKINRLISLYDE